jgi:Flp pilus assembly protein TadG
MLQNERGSVVVMGALTLVALIALAGLAVDAGRYFIVRAQLTKAVDGGALAGARVLQTGRDNARTAATEVARMNFAPGFMNTTNHGFSTQFTEYGEQTRVAVNGSAVLPTTLLKVVGIDQSLVTASAEAERRAISIALVLDNSLSMDESFAGVDAIGYLRVAAENFVGYFDNDMDRMSLTLFSSGIVVPHHLSHNFSGPMISAIQDMDPVANTNLADAMNSGYAEVESDPSQSSFKVVVFFTDGRPTALHDVYQTNIGPVEGIVVCHQNPFGIVEKEVFYLNQLHTEMPGVFYTQGTLPNGLPRTVPNLQATAEDRALAAASAARANDITVYTIGLGNPNNPLWWIQPNGELLVEMANAPRGIDPTTGNDIINDNFDPSQPEGEFYFVPTPEELEVAFDRLAQQIVLRLTL